MAFIMQLPTSERFMYYKLSERLRNRITILICRVVVMVYVLVAPSLGISVLALYIRVTRHRFHLATEQLSLSESVIWFI